MPTVPTLTPAGEAERGRGYGVSGDRIDRLDLDSNLGRSGLRGSANAAGAQVASAYGELGQGIEGLADAVNTIQERMDEVNVRELDNQYADWERTALHDPNNGFLAQRGRNAVEARQPFEQSVDARINELAQGARTDRARQAFLRLAQQRRDNTLTRAEDHTRTEFQRFENDTSEARMGIAARAIGDAWNDDAEIARQRGTIVSEAVAFGQRNGMAPEVIQELVSHQVGSAAADVWTMRANADPVGTRRILNNPEADAPLLSDLTAEQRARLLERIDNELERRAAHARAEAEHGRAMIRERVATSDFLWGQGLNDPNAVSPEVVTRTLGPEMGAAYSALYASQQSTGAMRSQSVRQLQAIINAPRPTSGDETAVRQWQANRVAANTVLQQRRENPMAYYLRQGVGGQENADPELMTRTIGENNWSGVQVLLRRRAGIYTEGARTYGGVEGRHPQLLTTQEAQALRGRLDAMTPAQREQALRFIRSGAMANYEHVAAQLYPDSPAGQMGMVRQGGAGSVASGGGRISSATASRRLLTGASILGQTQEEPEPPEQNANGTPSRQRPAAQRRPQAQITLPGDATLEDAFSAHVGDAYRNRPQQRAAAFQAFRAALAGTAAETGANLASLGWRNGALQGDDNARTAVEQALSIAVGDTLDNRREGRSNPLVPSRVTLPWGVSSDTFLAGVQAALPALQEEFPGAPIAGRRAQDFQYVPTDRGVYTLYWQGVRVEDRNGRPVMVRSQAR